MLLAVGAKKEKLKKKKKYIFKKKKERKYLTTGEMKKKEKSNKAFQKSICHHCQGQNLFSLDSINQNKKINVIIII